MKRALETKELSLDKLKTQQRWTIHKNKRPLNPRDGKLCNKGGAYHRIKRESARIAYCVNYKTAQEALDKWGGEGIGVYAGLGQTGAYVWGIDLDDCFNDDGSLKAFAQKIVDRFNTYTEVSGSRKGLHLLGISEYPLLQFEDPATRERKTQGSRIFKDVPDGEGGTIHSVELYSEGHYIRLTEDIYGEPKPLRNISVMTISLLAHLDRQKYNRLQAEKEAKKDAVAKKKKAEKKASTGTNTNVSKTNTKNVSTDAILHTMAKWKDKRVNAVLKGSDAVPDGFPSGSEADAYLLFKLAAFTHNAQQIRDIMMATSRAKARRDKWEGGSYGGLDWLDNEIAKAIEAVPIKYRPKKKPTSGSSIIVTQRKSVERVPEGKLLARLNGGVDAATDEDCNQHALWIKSKIAPLVDHQRKKLLSALEEYDLESASVLIDGEIEELEAIATALEGKDHTGWIRAESRYRIAKKYKAFVTDRRWIARLLFRWLNVEIKQLLQLDKLNGTTLYRDIVLPELKRCIGGKEAVTPYGLRQKNTYPERQQHCLVSQPVHALTNPKNPDYKHLKRPNGVDFKVPQYPDLVLTMGMPEDAQLTAYDKAVADALYSIAKWNNTAYIPLVLLCQVVKGSKDARITAEDKERARLSLRKLNSVWVHYREGKRYIEGSFINTIVYGETVNGEEDTATVYLNGIQLGYEYSANKLNHVITYGTYYREVPGLKLTTENALIVQYMLNRILLQRRVSKGVLTDGNHGIWSRDYFKTATVKMRLHYKTIFEQTGVTLNDSNKTRREKKQAAIISKTIPEALMYWKQIGVIAGYEEQDEDGLEIEINYTTHK